MHEEQVNAQANQVIANMLHWGTDAFAGTRVP